jgi:hypothetical protein
MSNQPFCRYCGKAISKRTRTVYFVEAILPHMKDDTWTRYVVGAPYTQHEAQRMVNETVVSLRKGRITKNAQGFSEVRRDLIDRVSTWDGESYSSEFFCSDRHSSWFAYGVLKGQPDLGMPDYHDAVARAAKKERAA